MNCNRFEEILSILHFNDNSKNKLPSDPAFNKLFKIQPLIDHFRKVFSQSVILETEEAIDEMMISRGCPIPTEKDLKKEGRGAMPQLFDERLGLLFVHGLLTVGCLRSRIASETISESNRYD